ncbi:unnamed protein product [Cuscuta campestris]|uniref:Protein kinase domain-containing protein n=1 Tax=Cuscuta campestris TaxID=132261 RepID=A0A484MCQ5_9ASTE|nr:unnamed protein product [Cuscuta campestris]
MESCGSSGMMTMTTTTSILSLLSIFFSFPLHSHAYTPPDRYFINCGSDSPITDSRRTFTGDDFFTGDSTELEDPNFPPSLLSIYKSARIFTGISRYELETDQIGPYILRLHFHPFSSSSFNLSQAKFNVSASGLSLLSNFSVPTSESPVIREFILPVKEKKLKIHFVPSQESSFAFVNAIEAFLAPDSSIDDEALPVGMEKMNIVVGNLSSDFLDVIQRINVGGSKITQKNDSLWRNWVPDDDYLVFREPEIVSLNDVDKPSYAPEWATPYDAPDAVYTSARVLTLDSNNTSIKNITWRFPVDRNCSYFLRLHFSDIVSPSRNDTQFDLFVDGEYVKMVSPYDRVFAQRTPFYFDYLFNSGDSGSMDLTVKPLQDSTSKSAFLNGVEIMKLGSEKFSVQSETQPRWKRLLVPIGPIVGGSVFLFLFGAAAAAFFFCLNSRKGKPVDNSDFPFDQIFGGSWQSHQNSEKNSIPMSPDVKNLGLKVPLTEILFATKNFDAKRMIGEGGFGKVYRGTMRNGLKVAVKRSEPGHGQGFLEFQTEILVLSKIRHRHLVSLIGYCDEKSEMILVYEFMEKGTLRDHLYSFGDKSLSLSWDQRLEICIGAAKGLHYLHAGLNSPIIHRDIKSTNILLDESYVAKVADFGISRSGVLDQSHVSTEVKGSFGYLDPEYYRCMQLTQKSDVYSFGVVLLEVICARPAIDTLLPREQVNLAEWAMTWQRKGQLGKIVDPVLVDRINASSLRKFGEIAEKCLQDYGVDRPSMADVMWDLEYALRLQHSGTFPLDPRAAGEDSSTDVSLRFPAPVFHRLPSHASSANDDDAGDEEMDSLTTNEVIAAREAFSQVHRVNGAR